MGADGLAACCSGDSRHRAKAQNRRKGVDALAQPVPDHANATFTRRTADEPIAAISVCRTVSFSSARPCDCGRGKHGHAGPFLALQSWRDYGPVWNPRTLEEVVDHYVEFCKRVKAIAPPGMVPPVARTDEVSFDRRPRPEGAAGGAVGLSVDATE